MRAETLSTSSGATLLALRTLPHPEEGCMGIHAHGDCNISVGNQAC
jgi:hypothetical protein